MKTIQVSPLIYEMIIELQKKMKMNNRKQVIEELVRSAYKSQSRTRRKHYGIFSIMIKCITTQDPINKIRVWMMMQLGI